MKHWKSMLTWLCRILTGATFIFSGFVKAIDPWGTLYKIKDYIDVFGFSVPESLIVALTFFLCGFEFVTGVFLLTGSFRRAAPLLSGLIMIVMLPLTLWIALKNPVADCGCFGDALIIDNWTTFWKNVALTAMTGWLIYDSSRRKGIISPYLQWILLVASSMFIVFIAAVGYNYQPLLDFRPYKTGTDIVADVSDSEDAAGEYRFIYEKDGVRKEFSEDDVLPDEDDGWVFVERIDPSKPEKTSEESDFHIFENYDDVTSEVMDTDSRKIILFMPDVSKVSIASTYMINSLSTWAADNDAEMFAVASGSDESIAEWRDLSLASYPIYLADDTLIKEVVRGNPGIVYLDGRTIRWKSTLKALNVGDFLSDSADKTPDDFGRDDKGILLNSSLIWVLVVALLVLLTYVPDLFGFKRRRAKRLMSDDKAHREG